ncbi:ABC transporter ATP-binding protein [Microvirga sp. HBU67558]|uniref:ABC transporter ATP-binding protein n=1 Tax=Microvirga TaxID=186650 RepID=UPI001B37E0B0|nr:MULTISPECIES: ABC transporter ATP-binding protein [unclassified Microvirga]MBQ0820317.1 ABC transporter ATP-binding protein [Microvirga sp. HBU67558]
MSLLSIRNVTKRFGGLVANDSISIEVPEGTLFAVIGPNGAGKTTLFNMVSGTFSPTSGSIHFDGQQISSLPQDEVAGRGLIRTYQLVQLFKDLTVAENVQVGFHRVTKGGIGSALFHPRWMREQEREIAQETRNILAFVGLGDRHDVPADQLPYGQQRLLEVARALAAKPRLMLLDEPAAGLNVQETEALAEVIRAVHARGITVVLIEHDMGLIMKVAQRIVVLDFGRKIAEGTPDEIRSHPDVIAAYLGGTEYANV